MTSGINVRPVGRLRGWLPAVLCGAGLIFIALITLWLRQTTNHVYANGASAITIRAVLRTNAEPDAIDAFTMRLRAKIPDAEIDVIDEAQGRSLLALQEPWIADMPDFEIAPLPTLIEIKHPQLLTNPLSVAAFVTELKGEPLVDFVAYNETAHDKMVKLAEATGSIQGHTVRWILIALVIAGISTQIAFGIITPAKSLLGIFLRHVGIWVASWMLGVLLFRLWEGSAVESGDWQRLTSSAYFAVGIAALGTMLVGEAVNTFAAWLRK